MKGKNSDASDRCGQVLELSRAGTKVSLRGDGEEDAPRPITTVERSSVSTPIDLDTLLLQGKEHHKSRNCDSARESRGSNAIKKRAISKVGWNERVGNTY